MTPIEKAETALNRRIEQIQAKLRAADSETTQRFLIQSLVVTVGIGEALTDYVKMIGQYAQGRHGELKQTHDLLTARHAELLKSGNALLERLKGSPGDRALRKEIELVQKNMAAIQKTMRRGANTLQREVAPSMAMIDKFALSIRRFCETDEIDTLKRAIKVIVGHVRELYLSQPSLPAKAIVDAEAWGKSAAAEIDQATDSSEAYGQAGYHVLLALAMLTFAVSQTPPRNAEEATRRATEAVRARLTTITERFTAR